MSGLKAFHFDFLIRILSFRSRFRSSPRPGRADSLSKTATMLFFSDDVLPSMFVRPKGYQMEVKCQVTASKAESYDLLGNP